MKKATFDISKVLTVLPDGSIPFSDKLGNIQKHAAAYSEIMLTGTANDAKIQKYTKQLVEAGFELAETVWKTDNEWPEYKSPIYTFRLRFVKVEPKKVFNLKFRGLDDYQRPVFKDAERAIYFGSTNALFNGNTAESDIVDFFKENPRQLEFFGSSFNCEPNGGFSEKWQFNFL